ncbi:MAG: hypothetical protein CVU44_05125 [Chloroflexi bacterium HGW-Chloroflexi-6]|nr:MAG: hypothetical protein CVU44_05125 [Chloroflexi bacterium HGW-Chloroflexi-6]
MNQKSTALRNIFTVLFFVFFMVAMLGGLFWANLLYVQRSSISLDFLPLWKGANNLLVEGLTPYGEFTTYEIQKMVYGRAAGPAELPLRVGMPLPLLLLFLPLGAFSDMELARAVWMVILEAGLILLVVFSVRLSQWQMRWFELLILFLFAFFLSVSIESLLSANNSILLIMFLLGALLAWRASLDELAGMLLAFSFFNLETGGLILLFLLIWATLNARWRILAGLLMTLTLLGGIAFIIDSKWVISFLMATLINWRANTDPSTFSLFTNWFPGLGPQIASGLTFVLLLLLMVESQQAFRRSALHWFWVACLAAAMTPLVGMPAKPASLVVLLPAFLLSASVLAQRWAVIGRWSSLVALALVFGGSWLFAAFDIQSGFLWMSLIALILLYSVRWWVARPTRLWADRISTEKTSYAP